MRTRFRSVGGRAVGESVGRQVEGKFTVGTEARHRSVHQHAHAETLRRTRQFSPHELPSSIPIPTPSTGGYAQNCQFQGELRKLATVPSCHCTCQRPTRANEERAKSTDACKNIALCNQQRWKPGVTLWTRSGTTPPV